MKTVTALTTGREDIHRRDSVVETAISPHFIDKRFDTPEIGGMVVVTTNHIGRLISIFVHPVNIWFASSLSCQI